MIPFKKPTASQRGGGNPDAPGGLVVIAALTVSLGLPLVAAAPAGATPKTSSPTPYEGSGHLDPLFHRDGQVVEEPAHIANSVAVQPDHNIVTVGTDGGSYVVTRSDPDGTPDRSFGTDGWVAAGFDSGYSDVANDGAVLGDGRIMATGTSFWAVSASSWADVSVMRFLPDGSLDPDWAGTGMVATDLQGAWDEAFGLASQPDGKTVVVGWTSPDGLVGDVLLVRYNADGTLDQTFGDAGIVKTDLTTGRDRAYSAAVQPDGKIAVSGQDGSVGVVLRYTADGALDQSFGQGGVVRSPDQAFWYDLQLQPDGKLVVAGESLSRFILARYLPDGTLDMDFGVEGYAVADFPSAVDGASSVAVQSDGKLVAVGSTWGTLTSQMAMARFLPDGSPDFAFGTDGKVLTDSGDWNSGGAGVTVQADGKIVVAGYRGDTALLSRYVSCTIEGTPGNDVLTGTPGADVICGHEGADTIRGAGGGDIVFGQEGNDRIDGGAGADFLYGGSGRDTVSGGAGSDWVSGGSSGDVLHGGDGTDRLDYSTSSSPVLVDLTTSRVAGGDASGDSVAEFEDATGSAYDDKLIGSPGPNLLEGGVGADTLDGAGGADILEYVRSLWGVDVDLRLTQQQSLGEAEGDQTLNAEGIVGSDFNDSLVGTDGRNILDGGPNDDSLSGLGGDDRLIGGTWNDQLDGGDGLDHCDGTLGDDIKYNCEA